MCLCNSLRSEADHYEKKLVQVVTCFSVGTVHVSGVHVVIGH